MHKYEDCLAHHGVKGQKWGVRRYQNEDGTLINPKGRTPAEQKKDSPEDVQRRKDTAKKIIIGAAGLALVGLSAYGAYKATGNMKTEMVNKALQFRKSEAQAARELDVLGRQQMTNARLDRMRRDLSRSAGNDQRVTSIHDTSMHWNMKSARRNMQASRMHAENARHYGDIAVNATRRNALRNWMKNKGRINISSM